MASLTLSKEEIAIRVKKFQEGDLVRRTTRWMLNADGYTVQVGSYVPPEDMFLCGWHVRAWAYPPELYPIVCFSVSDSPSTTILGQSDTDGGAYIESMGDSYGTGSAISLDRSPGSDSGFYLEKGKEIFIMAGASNGDVANSGIWHWGLAKLYFLRTYR